MIEMLVAVTILLIGVLGPLNMAVRGISDGLFVKNQITANYLAQEGLDELINLRDSNVASVGSPFAGFPSPCEREVLSYNTTNHAYEEGDSGATFAREICSVSVEDGVQQKVDVTISWKNKNLDKTLVLTSYLYAR